MAVAGRVHFLQRGSDAVAAGKTDEDAAIRRGRHGVPDTVRVVNGNQPRIGLRRPRRGVKMRSKDEKRKKEKKRLHAPNYPHPCHAPVAAVEHYFGAAR
jgi:hypothetical protein